MNFLLDVYLWVKALHVISMVAWMAGLFYLPRLFVYHCQTQRGSTDSERFKVMERKLLRQIMNPALIATYVFGLLMAFTPGVIDWTAPWWHVKISAIVVLTVFHMALGRWRKDFLHDRNTRSERFYRVANEIPTVLLVVIVVMVVVKPF